MRPHPRRTPARAVSAGLATALAMVTLVVGVQGESIAAAAPVAGAQTSGDSLFPDQGNGGYDVSHYDIALTYAATGSITAVTTIDATTTGPPLSSYSLDLEGLTVSAVTVDGAAATFARADRAGTTTDPGKHKLVVTPATPVDGPFTTKVTYSGTPTAHTDVDGSKEGWNTTAKGNIDFLNQPIGSMTGFPNNNTPSDRATYDIALTIPTIKGRAISNGVLVSTVASGLDTTYTWRQSRPMASELTLIAIGSFTEYTGAIDLGGGRYVPEWSYADTGNAASGIAAARAALPATLRYINDTYGPYPGEGVGILVDTSTVGYALETQDRPFFPTSVDDSTMTHEFTHQWFGDSVSPCDWNDIWMNEGPATFVPVEYDHVKDATQPTTETTFYNLWNSTAATSADWTVPPAAMTDPADLFGWQVYNRGAMTLEALRAEVGDSLFHQIMRAHLARNAGRCTTTRTFIDLTKELTNHRYDAELEAFFQDWLYQGDKPAWPAKLDLSLASAPVTGSTVTPGSSVTYTLTAVNTGKVPLSGGRVSTDVSSLLHYATVTTPLPTGLTLSGSTLTWTVPTTAVGATAVQPFTATVEPGAYAGNAVATSSSDELGATCTACTSTLRVDGPPDPATASPTASPTSPTASPTATVTVTQTAPTVTATVTETAPTATATVTATATPTSPTTSTPTSTATAAPAPVPVILGAPTVGGVLLAAQLHRPKPHLRGVPTVGSFLEVTARGWDPGTRQTYRWYADGHRVKGAHRRRLLITPRLRGTHLRATVSSTAPGYTTVVVRTRTTRPIG